MCVLVMIPVCWVVPCLAGVRFSLHARGAPARLFVNCSGAHLKLSGRLNVRTTSLAVRDRRVRRRALYVLFDPQAALCRGEARVTGPSKSRHHDTLDLKFAKGLP